MTAVETTSTGLTDGIGISAGYLLARYGFVLSLLRSRTVATGIVVVCGLAVVIRLKRERGRRRLAVTGLCVPMALLYALALVVPFLRSFYELSTPNALGTRRLGSRHCGRDRRHAHLAKPSTGVMRRGKSSRSVPRAQRPRSRRLRDGA